METLSPAPGDATPAPGNGKRLAIALGIIGNLPLALVSIAATKPVTCWQEGPQPFHASGLVGLLIGALLFFAGYGAYTELARRLWR